MNAELNPKRMADRTSANNFFSYYAGFSASFVDEVLRGYRLSESAVILDPWNGSGTTTFCAARNGISTVGIDLNPVMVVIARARTATYRQACSAIKRIENSTWRSTATSQVKDDALAKYLSGSSVDCIRASLASAGVRKPGLGGNYNPSVTDSFLLTIYFRAIKKLLTASHSRNPTWIRSQVDEASRLELSCIEFRKRLLEEAEALLSVNAIGDDSEGRAFLTPSQRDRVTVQVGDSRQMPLSTESVDLVVTSPPYCTRIDYAVATRIELSVMFSSLSESFDSLRRSMMGSTAIRGAPANVSLPPESYASEVLNEIRAHASKASSTYYFKTFSAYFIDLYLSLREIARTLKVRGEAVLVVQDSFYKDVHIDLAAAIESFAGEVGLRLIDRVDFTVQRNMREINPRAVARGASFQAKESILYLKKLEV